MRSDHLSHDEFEAGPEVLCGTWHSIGALELRRLVLEGAILVIQNRNDKDARDQPNIVCLSAQDSDLELASKLPDPEHPLICLAEDWMPATELAERLIEAGYQLVFTAVTHWGGLLAGDAAGALAPR